MCTRVLPPARTLVHTPTQMSEQTAYLGCFQQLFFLKGLSELLQTSEAVLPD